MWQRKHENACMWNYYYTIHQSEKDIQLLYARIYFLQFYFIKDDVLSTILLIDWLKWSKTVVIKFFAQKINYYIYKVGRWPWWSEFLLLAIWSIYVSIVAYNSSIFFVHLANAHPQIMIRSPLEVSSSKFDNKEWVQRKL